MLSDDALKSMTDVLAKKAINVFKKMGNSVRYVFGPMPVSLLLEKNSRFFDNTYFISTTAAFAANSPTPALLIGIEAAIPKKIASSFLPAAHKKAVPKGYVPKKGERDDKKPLTNQKNCSFILSFFLKNSFA